MGKVEIADLVKTQNSIKLWQKKIALKTLNFLKLKQAISIVLVGDKRIQELNNEYRHKNKITDVLSFGDWQEENFLGEVIICVPQAKRQAKDFGIDLKTEMIRLLVHGILHLAGYDHEKSKKEEKIMFGLQDQILKTVAGIKTVENL